MEINEFIDFRKLFVKLYEEHKEELVQYKFEADHYKRLIDFYDVHIDGEVSIDLISEECEITDKEINFVFGMDLGQANESSNYIPTATYVISYNRILGEFTTCDYEQG